MDQRSLSTLKGILLNSVVIDIDLSNWDEFVRIVIATDEDSLSQESDVYNIDFVGCDSLRYDSTGRRATVRKSAFHTRWTLDIAVVTELSSGFRVQMKGRGPRLELECADLRVERLTREVVSFLNNEWHKPGEGFIRPSAEAIFDKFVRGGSKHRKRNDR